MTTNPLPPPGSPNETTFLDGLATERQAAQFLEVTIRALQKGRVTGTGPRFVRNSRRCFRCRRGDVIAWIEARVKSSTAE